jgi:DNA-binding IclR family transcriptional regulator
MANPSPFPLTPQQRALLELLHAKGENPGWKAAVLGVKTGRPTASVRRSLQSLERRGLCWQARFDDWRITNPGVGAL